MGFVRRARTTRKVEIPARAKKEAEQTSLYEIVNNVGKFQIHSSLVLNIDQTNSKNVSMGKTTIVEIGWNLVHTSGLSGKRSMTTNFTITLNGKFLPMQLIYWGKTNQSLPKFEFPVGFSLSANPKHYNNTTEYIKLIKEIIIPYIEKERTLLKFPKTQPTLLIMNVFPGQITEDVLTVPKDNNILLNRVPANMTHIFQPLDLTVNGTFRNLMHKKFSEWHRRQILHALEIGCKVMDVKMDFKLTIMKPLHAKCLSEFCNYINFSFTWSRDHT